MSTCSHCGAEVIDWPNVNEMRAQINDLKAKGFDSAVFVGRNQMTAILAWAVANCYLTTSNRDDLEGDHRPEIEGLPVYRVNADNYFRVA